MINTIQKQSPKLQSSGSCLDIEEAPCVCIGVVVCVGGGITYAGSGHDTANT